VERLLQFVFAKLDFRFRRLARIDALGQLDFHQALGQCHHCQIELLIRDIGNLELGLLDHLVGELRHINLVRIDDNRICRIGALNDMVANRDELIRRAFIRLDLRPFTCIAAVAFGAENDLENGAVTDSKDIPFQGRLGAASAREHFQNFQRVIPG